MKIDLVATVFIFSDNKVLLVHHKKLNKWLPVGGHIEKNETPDDTIIREAKEETNLNIKILNQSDTLIDNNVKRKLAIPFYADVHNVGDHDHCSLFYIAKATNSDELKINDELLGYRWFSKDDLEDDIVLKNVRNQALKAFEIYKIYN
ncbi:MAG: NUDIX domain-containing protein [Patescibacteria group bacterium]